ncbi:hypothetical protein D3C80_796070 [compost metagenome]
MQAFRRKRPEIPHSGRRTQVGLWMTLLGVNEVRELQRITHEENWRVVANQIPIAFFGVELQCKAAHIALGISCTLLTGNSREASQHWGFGTRLQRLGLGVFRNIASNCQRAECTPTLGVNDALRNTLTVLVRQLFNQLIVLQQNRTALTSGKGILVIRDWRTSACSHNRTVCHGNFPPKINWSIQQSAWLLARHSPAMPHSRWVTKTV